MRTQTNQIKNEKKEYKFLEKWTKPNNYAGEEYWDYYRTIGQHRDSEILERSNFESLLEKLGGETETVIVVRSGHWAVGWVEGIYIHESDKEKLELANEILKKYADYPVIDDDDYSERQNEYYDRFAHENKDSVAATIVKQFGLPEECAEDKELLDLSYQLHMEAQYYGGEDDCCNFSNQYRETYSDSEWEEFRGLLKRVLSECYNIEKNPYMEFLAAALDLGGE